MKREDAISNEITLNANDIALEMDPNAEADASDTFCKAWPSAKQGLELLKDIVKGSIAKAAIALVIGAGDAVSSKVCHLPQ